MFCAYSHPRYLLASIFSILSLAAFAQDTTFSRRISPQVTVHVTQDDAGTVSVRHNEETNARMLLEWPGQELNDVLTHDMNADGYDDLVFVSAEFPYHDLSRIFLYRPDLRGFIELKHPDVSFHTIQFVEKNVFSSSKYADEAFGEPYLHLFSIVNNEALVLMESETLIFVGNAWPIEIRQVKQFDQHGQVHAQKFYDYESGLPFELTVNVSKLDLYTEPQVNAFSSMYLITDDVFTVLDVQGNDWLQIQYDSPRVGKIVRWVRFTDLEVDKHASTKDSLQGLSLTLLYPYYDADSSVFIFSVGLNNQGKNSFETKDGMVYLLFTDEAGRKIPSFLYRTGLELNLGPKTQEETFNQDADGTSWYQPSVLLDDNYVEWDEEAGRYVIFHGRADGQIEYIPFFPPLTPGKYKMQAIFTDFYALSHPVFSNEQEINYPIVKKSKVEFISQ